MFEQNSAEPAADFSDLLDQYVNTSFSVETFSQGLRNLILDQAARTSRANFSVSPRDREALVRAKEAGLAMLGAEFDKLIEMTERRRENLLRFDGVTLMSLGHSCFSRTVPTRWGLKKTAAFGEKSYPFDLAVHRMESVNRMIRTDFEGYLDANLLEFDEKGNHCVNHTCRVRFNHETGREYAENGFEKLRAVYSSRIENFNHAVDTFERIAFVAQLENGTNQDGAAFLDVVDALQNRRVGKESAFILINAYNVEKHQPIDTVSTHHMVEVRNIPLPAAGYVWYAPAHYFTDEGFAFEKQVTTEIGDFIESRLLPTPTPQARPSFKARAAAFLGLG